MFLESLKGFNLNSPGCNPGIEGEYVLQPAAAGCAI